MAGTRSAPTVDLGTPNRITLSVRLMDAGGEKRAVSLDIPSSATDTQIDAYVNAMQAVSNATIYEVSKQEKYTSVPLEANTETDSPFVSVFDNLVLGLKDVANNKLQDAFVPAVEGIIVLDGDVIDTEHGLYTAFRDAADALLGANYTPVSARFTERRDKNDSVPA